jgi:trigger factor
MKWEVKDEKNCRKAINITVEKDDIKKVYDDVFKNIKNNAQLDGFRKGKAPDDVIKKRFAATIKEEVQKDIIPKAGTEVLENLKLHLVTYPGVKDVKFESDEKITFTLIAEVNAEFELKDYKDIKIAKKELKDVTDADVEREISRIRQSRGTLKEAGRDIVKEDDYATVGMLGTVEGKAEAELTGENEMIRIGSKTVPAELENGIKGMKLGQEKEIKVKFPKDYVNKKYATKEAVFKVKVKNIKTLDVPEFNDEFVKSLAGKYKTAAELKEAIKEELKKQAEADVRNQNLDMVFKELLKRNGFEVAEGLIEHEAKAILSRYENQLQSQGLTIEKLGLNREEIKNNYNKAAEESVRLRYILRKVAEAEKIEVKDSDVEEEIKKIAATTNEDTDAMIKRAKSSWDALKAQFLEDKVVERLMSYIK